MTSCSDDGCVCRTEPASAVPLPTPLVHDPSHAAPANEHGHAHHHAHQHGHQHGHEPGPLADASVRRARPSDAPAVGIVQAQAMAADYAQILPPQALAELDPATFGSVWRRSLAEPPSPRHLLLVACAGEQVVGFAAFGPSEDPDADDETAELLTLSVHPQARGEGHGSRLVNAVVDDARSRGFTWLHAWVLLDTPQYRDFLQRAGMAPDRARRTRAVDDERTVMEVRLGAGLGTDE